MQESKSKNAERGMHHHGVGLVLKKGPRITGRTRAPKLRA